MYWGIDLGGTKMEGVVMSSLHPDNVLMRHRIDTEGSGGYDHIISRIQLLVNTLAEQVNDYPQTIGIGTPGTIDPATNTLKNSNTLCLNGRTFAIDLGKKLNAKVVTANDANSFALAETHMGAVSQKFPSANVVFGIIMGTGVGGGIVINGKILQGLHGIGGEWGHMFLDESGTDCYCGRHGCVETIISGTALEKFYFSKTARKKSLPEILANLNDPVAAEVKQRLIHFFGKGVGQIINVLDPDVIVLGGGLGNIDFLYTEGVREIARNIFNPTLLTPVVSPILGDSAGVFGAAMLTADY